MGLRSMLWLAICLMVIPHASLFGKDVASESESAPVFGWRGRNLVGIGIDPLQPAVLRDAMEVFQGEDVGRGGGDCHGAFGASQ